MVDVFFYSFLTISNRHIQRIGITKKNQPLPKKNISGDLLARAYFTTLPHPMIDLLANDLVCNITVGNITNVILHLSAQKNSSHSLSNDLDNVIPLWAIH